MTLIPQLAESADFAAAGKLIGDTNWYLEQKLDGHRILIRFVEGRVTAVLGRGGQAYTKGLPSLAVSSLLNLWIDAELVAGQLWAFDAITLAGTITPNNTVPGTNLPFVMRRAQLENLFKADHLGPTFHLVPSVWEAQEKLTLLSRLHGSAEGFMLKHADGRYLSGQRNPKMVKVKFVETVDCIVTEVNRNGKASIGVSLADDDGTLYEVGAVTMIGKPDVKVGDVVEVRYLYAGANGRLYQPSFLRKRDDKHLTECTLDQLKHVNKHVFSQRELFP